MLARENPFRVERVTQLPYRSTNETSERLLRRWDGMGRRANLVGARGTGKTTLLETLERKLRQDDFRVLKCSLRADKPRRLVRAEQQIIRDLDHRGVVLLDGAESLPRWQWKRLLRQLRPGVGFLGTQHAPGRLPTLYVCRTSPEVLRQLVAELLAAQPVRPAMADGRSPGTVVSPASGKRTRCIARTVRSLCAKWNGLQVRKSVQVLAPDLLLSKTDMGVGVGGRYWETAWKAVKRDGLEGHPTCPGRPSHLAWKVISLALEGHLTWPGRSSHLAWKAHLTWPGRLSHLAWKAISLGLEGYLTWPGRLSHLVERAMRCANQSVLTRSRLSAYA